MNNIKKKIFRIIIGVLIGLIVGYGGTYFYKYFGAIKNSKNLVVGKLDNGLDYYILKNSKPKNRAELYLVIETGSVNETEKERGLTHFLEHMGFNGTEKFPGNSMDEYLNSIGLRGNINASTHNEKTIYFLTNIPADSKTLDSGFLILHEWAKNMTLDQKEIDAERNVVLTEWRMSQTLDTRIWKHWEDVFYYGSPFYNKDVLGDTEVLKTANRETFLEYYNKWYNPKNMSLVIVGDVNQDEIEKFVKKYFSYENKKEALVSEKFEVKPIANTILTFSDKEIDSTTLNITAIGKSESVNNMDAIKNHLIKNFYANIMNSRFSRLTKDNNYPLFSGEIMMQGTPAKNETFNLTTVIKETQISDGIFESLQVLKVMAEFGPHKEELEMSKKELLVLLNEQVNNITDSQYLVNQVMNIKTYGDSYLNPEDELKYKKRALEKISEKDIKNFAKKFYDAAKIYYLTYPQHTNSKVPDQKEIEKILEEIKNKPVTNFPKPEINNVKFSEISAGEIIESKIINEGTEFQWESYTLSNGIKVFYKETEFEKDKIYLSLFKEEGSSTNNDTEYLNSEIATNVLSSSGVGNLSSNETEFYMKDKNFGLTFYINDYEHGVNIYTDKNNFETGISVLTTMLLNKKFDDKIYEKIVSDGRDEAAVRWKSPTNVFEDEISKILYKNNPRRRAFLPEDFDKISKKEILKIYDEKFSNFADFNILVLGSIKKPELEKILKEKFAGLPTDSKKSKKLKDLNIKFGAGVTKNKSYKIIAGQSERAIVRIYYPYHADYKIQNTEINDSFIELLNTNLFMTVREKLSGVYEIYAESSYDYNTHGENFMVVNFEVDPAKINEILVATKKLVKEISSGKYDKSKIKDIYETYKIAQENNLRENSFWIKYLYKNSLRGYDGFKILSQEEFQKNVNYETLKDFSKKNIDPENYVVIILEPEKK
ncbi:MAG: M16 family metallopeptidase [Fusobacteriaceae bacterium]